MFKDTTGQWCRLAIDFAALTFYNSLNVHLTGQKILL